MSMENQYEVEQIEDMDRQTADSVDLNARVSDASPVSDRPDDIDFVDLDKINANEIQSAADFNNPEKYNALHREAEMLGQMEPSLEQGADSELYHSWDESNQIGQYSPEAHVRGYADVYGSYYTGGETVALDPKPDGGYDVINGRHRICAARDAGLTRIPAKVLG